MGCCISKKALEEKIEQLNDENEQLKKGIGKLKTENEFSVARFYRENVVFDDETAHPRLEVSENGKCVMDTGNVSNVSKSEQRFDHHMFILAKDGFSKGNHYWEVEVGQKKNWILGVASESACRTGIIKLSPNSGYWVVKCEGGKEYWAQENCLKLNEKPTKIGIFLNISDKSIVFYDVQMKIKLHSYTINDSFPGKLYPFFSTGLETDRLPLRIPSWFEDH